MLVRGSPYTPSPYVLMDVRWWGPPSGVSSSGHFSGDWPLEALRTELSLPSCSLAIGML